MTNVPRWSNPVQVLLLSATRKFSLSLISPRRYFALEHLIKNSKSKIDLVFIESWPSHFHFHKKRNKRWLQQRILYWQDKARHENVWHENFHKRGKKFSKENSLSMGFCIRALHLRPNISMKMIKITFLFFVGWPDFVVFAFNRLRPSGSALDLLRFYFLIKNINNFFQFRKNVLFLQKKTCYIL